MSKIELLDNKLERSELLISITDTTITAYLSVDGGEFNKLSFLDTARLLSDLACATTASVVSGYENEQTMED